MNITQAKKLTKQEKEALLKEILGKDYDASGKSLPALSKVIDYVGRVDTTLSLVELIPTANIILRGSSFFSTVASSASIISIVMFPVSTMIDIVNAYQTGHKLYSYRAIAYALTSWAYGMPMKSSSKRILSNARRGIVKNDKKTINEYNLKWRKASSAAISQMHVNLAAKNIPKEVMQLVLRALSDNSEQELCLIILKGFEKELSHIEKLTWKSLYSVKYPN